MSAIDSELDELRDDAEPGRRIRLRLEGPAGWRTAATPRPVVVVLHGFKGFMHWGFFPEVSRRFAAAGYVCVSMNASGSGVGDDLVTIDDDDAFAGNTFSRELEDLDRVRAYARALPGVDGSREGLLGHSRGGGVALLSAGTRAPGAAVTWAALDSVDRLDEEAKRAWREAGVHYIPNARTGQVHRLDLVVLEDAEQNAERLDILAAAARSAAPTLVVHAEDDPAVDVAGAGRLHAALPNGVLLVLDEGGHTFGARHPFEGNPAPFERVWAATLAHLDAHLRA